jgi:ATP-dependent Lon protease
MQQECTSPVVILDELDKAQSSGIGDDPAGFLYGLLEPSAASRFIDAAIGLPIDASRISWIATSNSTAGIHPAILSRMTVVEINAPTPAQMPAVVASIHRDLLQREDWGAWFDQPLNPEAEAALALLSPREVRLAIEDMYASAAAAGRRAVQRSDVPGRRQQGVGSRPIGFIHNNSQLRKTA